MSTSLIAGPKIFLLHNLSYLPSLLDLGSLWLFSVSLKVVMHGMGVGSGFHDFFYSPGWQISPVACHVLCGFLLLFLSLL